MHIESTVVLGNQLLILSGRLHFGTRHMFLKTLEQHTQTFWKRMLIDLQHISFIDSAGLGILAVAVNRIHEIKRELFIVNPRGQVLALLQLTNFPTLVPVVESDHEYTVFTRIA